MISQLERRRQFIHMLSGVVLGLLLYLGILNKITAPILFLIGSLICWRCKQNRIPVIYSFLRYFEREKDLEKFPGKGALFFLGGATLVILLFPKDIALASILILAFGDSVSHLVGRYGSIKHPFNSKKYVEGSVAGAVVAFIAAFVILNNPIEAGLAAVLAMFVEGLNIELWEKKVDDNLLVPLVSGVVIWVLRFFL
jgi:dolichol kinase